jgi:hypothetical protein
MTSRISGEYTRTAATATGQRFPSRTASKCGQQWGAGRVNPFTCRDQPLFGPDWLHNYFKPPVSPLLSHFVLVPVVIKWYDDAIQRCCQCLIADLPSRNDVGLESATSFLPPVSVPADRSEPILSNLASQPHELNNTICSSNSFNVTSRCNAINCL